MNALGRGARRGRARTLALPLVLALAVAVAVGGCSPDAEPSPMPTPSSNPSPSESESPGPTPPVMPPEASGTSPAAAKAFVRHYFDQINYAALTGDTAPLRALSTEDCESCDAIASNVERIYGDGGHMQTDGWKLTVVSPVPARGRLRPAFDLGVRQSPEKVYQAEDTAPETYPGGKLAMTIYLQRSADRWVVERLDEVAS